MPPLQDTRREKFCAGVVLEGLSVIDSYEQAGYVRNRQNAWKLRHRDDVERRCSELIEQQQQIHAAAVVQAIEKKQITVESILDDLHRALTGAEKDQDWRTVVQAAVARARVAGLMVEKHLVKAHHSFDPSSLTDEELNQHIDELKERQRGAELELCERVGLDPETSSIAELWAAQDQAREEEREERAAMEARDVTAPPQERVSVYRPPRVKMPKLLNGGASQNATSVDRRRR
jgi:hypothetical protein